MPGLGTIESCNILAVRVAFSPTRSIVLTPNTSQHLSKTQRESSIAVCRWTLWRARGLASERACAAPTPNDRDAICISLSAHI